MDEFKQYKTIEKRERGEISDQQEEKSAISNIIAVKKPIRAIEVNMERRRNVGVGEMGDPRENPLTNKIVRHDSHLRKSGDPAGEPSRDVSGYSELPLCRQSKEKLPSIHSGIASCGVLLYRHTPRTPDRSCVRLCVRVHESELWWGERAVKPGLVVAVSSVGVDAVLGHSASLPCDIETSGREDRVYMVLWFREGAGRPLYSLWLILAAVVLPESTNSTRWPVEISCLHALGYGMPRTCGPYDMATIKCAEILFLPRSVLCYYPAG
ncbi:hypothetical protein PR048_015484 [Dryococelus australis]|uniref:Uncharacterized protein n=1 Tax=Dryococelus australis TaxID=614101 RepID=A0ABQ9HH26_9NEOP|nr:hypothetical protein PR048_015484 [Dryococelus australis]